MARFTAANIDSGKKVRKGIKVISLLIHLILKVSRLNQALTRLNVLNVHVDTNNMTVGKDSLK